MIMTVETMGRSVGRCAVVTFRVGIVTMAPGVVLQAFMAIENRRDRSNNDSQSCCFHRCHTL